MTIDYSGIWLVLEWIIFIMMVGPAPLFFVSKYRKDKAKGNKGGAAFNLGYFFFFIFTALNQLIYIIDATSEYSAAIGWDQILDAEIISTVLFDFALKSQIILMLCLFFWSFVPIMFPIEKYIRKSEMYPITILLLIGAITSAILWFVFCYLLIPQPLELIGLQIIIAIILLISVVGLLISILAFLYFYLKVAISSTGAVRKKAFLVTFGIFFIYFSLIGGNLTRPNVTDTPFELIGPICLILGIVILIYGFKLKGF